MGISAGPFWATSRTYVASLARIHATHLRKDFTKISGLYFGIFYMMQVNCSYFFSFFLIEGFKSYVKYPSVNKHNYFDITFSLSYVMKNLI